MVGFRSTQSKDVCVLPERRSLWRFRSRLLKWYEGNGRSFPWRRASTTMYRAIVAEMLLQRTRAETVAAHFPGFFEEYPSWRALGEAPLRRLGRHLQPMGLWRRRAVSLRALAKEMGERNGRFPKSRQEIEQLPGVGQYIANSILLLCHGRPEPLLDVNMARVLERVFGPRKLADIRYDPYLQSLAKRVVRCRSAREINWAILDLAATVCRPRRPRCHECPASSLCCTFRRDQAREEERR